MYLEGLFRVVDFTEFEDAKKVNFLFTSFKENAPLGYNINESW